MRDELFYEEKGAVGLKLVRHVMADRWSRQLLTQVAADGAAGLDERRLVEVAQGADVESEVSGGRMVGRLHQQRTVDLWRGLGHRFGRSCNEHGAAGAMSDSRRDVQA